MVRLEPIALSAGKFEADPVGACNPVVMQHGRRSVEILHYEVDVAVVVQICCRQAPADTGFPDGRAGQSSCVTEGTVLLVYQ